MGSYSAEEWINALGLIPHPEGGFYREIYRSDESIAKQALPERYDSDRSYSTSIYFLLNSNQVSKLHRIKSDEIWHHYDGCPLKITWIDASSKLNSQVIGKDIKKKYTPQLTIPKNSWFGAKTTEPDSYCLLGCTVSPGFDFQDFEMATASNLPSEITKHLSDIQGLI